MSSMTKQKIYVARRTKITKHEEITLHIHLHIYTTKIYKHNIY